MPQCIETLQSGGSRLLDTRAFLAALAAHVEADLAFAHADFAVPVGFHLTEVKALAVEGMDCGGRTAGSRRISNCGTLNCGTPAGGTGTG